MKLIALVLLLTGCGGVTAAAVGDAGDAGSDATADGGGAGDVALEAAAGDGSRDATADTPCTGCMQGSTCIPPADQTDNVCGMGGAPCGRTMLECLGTTGGSGCLPGEQVVRQRVCNAGGIARRFCCPLNACSYDCPPCTNCP